MKQGDTFLEICNPEQERWRLRGVWAEDEKCLEIKRYLFNKGAAGGWKSTGVKVTIPLRNLIAVLWAISESEQGGQDEQSTSH